MNDITRAQRLIIKQLLEAVQSLPNEEFEKLSNDSYLLEIKVTRKKCLRNVAHKSDTKALSTEIIDVMERFQSREEAMVYLSENIGTRKEIEVVARKLDIPVSQQDKAETLKEKIVEATVGARLRSLAIKGDTAS